MSRPYSEATVDLVKRAAWKLWDDPDTRPAMPVYDGGLERILGAALDALAAAGLLLPEGAETNVGWQVKFISEGGSHVVGDMREQQAHAHASHHGRLLGCRAEVHQVTSYVVRKVAGSYPQRPDAVRLAVGDSKPTQDHGEVSGV